MENQVDIKENYIRDLDSELLSLLLIDRTTKKNIIWATNDYSRYGLSYKFSDGISLTAITGRRGSVIKPRVEKSKEEIQKRIRNKAEVFTPSWVCNCQNNLVDNAWFGYDNAFNIEDNKTWTATTFPVKFPEGKNWQQYVKENRLEITCGEAPYLVSRYDTVSGEIIPLDRRIGVLDRKLRIVNENAVSDEEWLEWAKWALKSVYGYEWQGDNVLLARENLLFTFIDYYVARFKGEPSTELLKEIAEIISWNIWQMDGLKCIVPNSCRNDRQVVPTLFGEEVQGTLCEGCAKGNIKKHNGIYCKIKDWQADKAIRFVTLIKNKGKK
ncbi:MAG: restriction endonuclease subunit M [Muribaculaceae bacterium]|nr:restriction endonuclease subunit M [Muribaculaceae bacterium]